MCVNPLVLSNNYIDRALKSNIPISPMKLQKLLYFTYRDYLKETGNSLFSERFGTWQYGPVLESVYHEFKRYGSRSIDNYDAALNDETGKIESMKVNEDSNPELKKILNDIWGKASNMNGIQLSQLTHRAESAWFKAYQADEPFLSDGDIINDTVEI